jgi:predicted ATP-dependent protease
MRAKKFFVWPLTSVDEAIELLLDTPAGQPDAKGQYPTSAVHGLVMERLAEMALAAEEGGKLRSSSKPSREGKKS